MASDLSQCPPVIQLVKSSPDVEREYINRALRALARCIGHSAIPDPTGHAGEFLSTDGTDIFWATASGGSGTVTSVQVSGGSTGLSFSGGPITTSGTITMSGTLGIGNGGTGQTTANAALNALLPSQATHNGKFLQTNGTNSSWQTVTSGGQVDSIVPGDGIDVDATDPVNPIVEVKISADAGNQISFGSDDGLFASGGGGGGSPYITGIAPDGDEADPWSWSPTLNNPGSTALWEVTDGSLPGGASINSSTGVCSASALTGNGDISFEVAATITSGTGAGASCYSRQNVSIAPAGLLWDASASNSNFVFTNGGRDAQNSYSFWCTAIGNIGKASGKHQFEIHCISGSASNVFAGVADKTNAATWLLSNVYLGNNSGAYVESVGYWGNGTLYYSLSSGISFTSGLSSWTTGDVITITLDLTVPEVKFYKNGVLATTRAIPAGKTWYPGTSIQGGLASKTRLVGSGLTYPQSGFTDWA